jgi:hypothetical protein
MALWRDPLFLEVCRFLLAGTFALAAWAKLRAREEFVGVVRNFRILPHALATPFATALPMVEAAVAIGLLVGPAVPAAAGGAAFLLLLFLSAIVVNLLRGRREIDCGCFRSGLRQTLGWGLALRNAALAGTAVWLASGPATLREATAADLLLGLVASAVLMALYGAAGHARAAARRSPRGGMAALSKG